MKVLLVVYDNASYIHWFPQGLAYIAAVLRGAGHDVSVYNQDVNHWPESHLTAFLDCNRFDVVGVGVIGGYYQYRKLLKISEAINRSEHRPLFVVGGHGPAPEPEYFLTKTQADVAVIGEGETTIVELLRAAEDGLSFENVDGIAFRTGNKVSVNRRRELIEDVDTIPFPAYDLFPMDHYRLLRMPHCSSSDFVMPMLSGRGCPFKCTFCYRMDEGFRGRSSESIIEEVRFLKANHGITYVAFSDELLMSNEERTIDLCEAFISAELDVKWDCNGRLNFAKPDVLKVMRRAGCVFINYGIESVDDQVLKNYRKGLTYETIVKGIEETLTAGMSPGLNIIFGNIGDTEDTLQRSVEFLLAYDDFAQMRTIRPVTPYPGSELYRIAIERGLLKDVTDFYESKHVNSDLVSVNFTDMSDDEFHGCLLNANTRLLRNYFSEKEKAFVKQAETLYVGRDAEFRGYRQS